MDAVVVARNEIEPLLNQLIQQLAEEGKATERAIYSKIQKSLRHARTEFELTVPFSSLSTSAYVGFELSGDASLLLARILEKAKSLAEEMEGVRGINH